MDVSQYLEIFIDETSEHLQNLNDGIMTLEKEPEDKDVINELFRAAHSLKGMAGTMGFKRMQHLTHDMENLFQEVRSDRMKVTSALIDVMFDCLDAISEYLENVKSTSDEGTNENEAIIQELNAILKEGTAANQAEENSGEEEEQQESDIEVKNQHEFALSEEEEENIKTAQDAGHKVYEMTITIQKDCLLKAARAFLVFRAVEDYGHIIVYKPSAKEIEEEKFEQEFSIFLDTEESDFEKIKTAASSVSEVESVTGALIQEEELRGETEESDKLDVVEPEESKTETMPVQSNAPVAMKQDRKPASGKGKANMKPVTNRTIRVDIEKLDALMNQVSELIIAKNSLVAIGAAAGEGEESGQSFEEQIEYLERITTSLHESVMKVRMVPIESVVNKFPRMIRDLSKTLNKKMELEMTGEDTELDRTVVDQLGDPLQHLLRNSADHGLESAELRKERGKNEVGSIYLNAFQEGNNVIIEVGDDGNGIDTENVKRKAIERGLVTQEAAEQLSQKEIIDFLFMPSFSMAKQISDISGRGVGLDVVKSNIEALGGDVEVRSVLGEGSKFIVRLPLTLAIIQALMVEIRDEKYAIALASIQTIEYISTNDIKYVESKEVIHIRGEVIPLIRMDQALDFEPAEDDKNLTVVIVQKGDKTAGLVIDNLIGQQEIVIKSLGAYISTTKLISGATILGDGEVALILDVNILM
ncbi:MAG: chemotaxis protein CheA [Lachnospiraceae bacterium]|nr:chemotaxis protein CheA [Lachnospiraceae bacterium]